jgi:GT2 family glycosyltransferase
MISDKKHPLVSVVILAWNSADFMENCLSGLSKQSWQNYEIIVVDNASGDDTVNRVKSLSYTPKLILIENKKNLGCAGGNNVGWRASSGEIVIFLNPDTYVTFTWMEEFVSGLLSDPDAAIAGCKIYYPNSHIIQHAGGILYPNAMSDHYGNAEEDVGQYDEIRDVDYVTGAAIALRRDFLEVTGGMDEDYFPAYYEETDLCYRAHKNGKKVLYVPGAVLYHHESAGLTKLSARFYAMFYKMRIRFVLKNYSFMEILTKFIPFEIRWMLFEKKARGLRLCQLKAYWQGIKFLITHNR